MSSSERGPFGGARGLETRSTVGTFGFAVAPSGRADGAERGDEDALGIATSRTAASALDDGAVGDSWKAGAMSHAEA